MVIIPICLVMRCIWDLVVGNLKFTTRIRYNGSNVISKLFFLMTDQANITIYWECYNIHDIR